METPPPATEVSDLERRSYAGKRFYSPSAIYCYCLLTLIPVGLLMFGINLYRAGRARMGAVMVAMAAVALVFAFIGAAATDGEGVSVRYPAGAIVALGLLRLQHPDYSRAIARGARPAAWWPPLVVIILLVAAGAALAGLR